MIIYLDNCCYNRPFDDQTQERIHLESEVILTVLKMGQMKQVVIAGSEILELEMNRMQDENKKQKVLIYLALTIAAVLVILPLMCVCTSRMIQRYYFTPCFYTFYTIIFNSRQ